MRQNLLVPTPPIPLNRNIIQPQLSLQIPVFMYKGMRPVAGIAPELVCDDQNDLIVMTLDESLSERI